MRRFLRGPKGVIGLVILTSVLMVAVFAPLLIPAEAGTRMDMTARLSPPTIKHWLGADQLGRDLLVRMLLGTHTSLLIAVSAVGLSIVVGLPRHSPSPSSPESKRPFARCHKIPFS